MFFFKYHEITKLKTIEIFYYDSLPYVSQKETNKYLPSVFTLFILRLEGETERYSSPSLYFILDESDRRVDFLYFS